MKGVSREQTPSTFSVVQDNGKDPETFLTFYNIARFFLCIR